MLSYQHAYHAGNLADVHKHSLLAWVLNYLIQKDKPLSYIETHAGRGLYDLGAEESLKTAEAAGGITITEQWVTPDHPYRQRLSEARAMHGKNAYPGSPLIAALSLRDIDTLHLCELHPTEVKHLRQNAQPWGAHVYDKEGFSHALALCPPTPRRGCMLIDPSYEVKSDYDTIPKSIAHIHRKWNVGIIMLWYPILTGAPHLPMLTRLAADHPEALRHEVRFPPVREGHRMTGSGMFIINPPYGLDTEAKSLTAHFRTLL
ncbi:MAG: 23S rRNA (adenine(2030)-N(6))-methyltransferase RlmJ [Paracoccaceae bacterium]